MKPLMRAQKTKRDGRKERAMALYNRFLAGPMFDREQIEDCILASNYLTQTDRIMSCIFKMYSAWMQDTLDEYVEFVPELRDTELAERRKSEARKRKLRE